MANEPEMASIKPMEGGLEDMTETRPDLEKAASYRKGKKRERKGKHGRRHRKNKGERKKKKGHKKSVKKDLSKKSKKDKTKKLVDEVKVTSQEEKDEMEVKMKEFYNEHPDFKKNVATITDGTEVKETTTEPGTTENTAQDAAHNEDVAAISESYDDDHIKDIYDEDDDSDDAMERGNESVSGDESSENYNDYYDYYDEDGDSSYSSSEIRAEQEMLKQTPSDWYKDLDQMQGDQPRPDEDESKDSMEEIYQKYIKKAKKLDPVKELSDSNEDKKTDDMKTDDTKDEETTETEENTDDSDDLIKKDGEIEETKEESVPKTDIEPSTSPNPPTSKTDVKPIVTDPTYPQWKDRVETWNLIESKPVGEWACGVNLNFMFGKGILFYLVIVLEVVLLFKCS